MDVILRNETMRVEHSGIGSRFNFIDIANDGGMNSALSTMTAGYGPKKEKNVIIIKYHREFRQVQTYNFASQEWMDYFDFGEWKDAKVIFDSRIEEKRGD